MEKNDALMVDVPDYARKNKNGSYYAMKRDMPYFENETGIRGYIVIGTPAEEAGKMYPNWAYDQYCTPECVIRKAEEEEARKKKEEEEARKAAEEAAEMERTLGEKYVSLDELEDEISCYPVNGYLTEKFFDESGLSSILEEVLGAERACLIKLSAALIATQYPLLSFDGLNAYPMNLHMLYSMDRFFTSELWSTITEEEIRNIFELWIRKVNPGPVSSMVMESKVTLYHDKYSDRIGDLFSSRIRRGTIYHWSMQLYRDEKSNRLLAVEGLKYHHEDHFDPNSLLELYTIKNSDYPEMRNASIRFFLPSYLYLVKSAIRQHPTTAWIHPSQYPDLKEIDKKIKQLQEVSVTLGYRILRWNGCWEETEGTWALVENVFRRDRVKEDARRIMQSHKDRLQLMSYYPACTDSDACYFDIRKEDDDGDFFDSAPFTVKALPGATGRIRRDYGRFLCFTTEGSFSDEQLIRQVWQGEDMLYQYNVYKNQGETTDVTDEYFKAMGGRELPLFLASAYREWIYDHIGDLFDQNMEVSPFVQKASEWKCKIQPDGQVEGEMMNPELEKLLMRFDTTPDDLISRMAVLVKQRHYFSETFVEW